ncbi:hypothetical protein DWG18_01175 [Lysobacter sp. TY2-98]|uniref:hypothetical protein n=1 Tax=Lysobacter sp. TY2-98 TaxID=2290922 RepID=UPI000E1FE560|nr:hypothetical protein [Lysobacter sp. TY2-98]AXK71031.1 hypothetical protein DWG18_01175 [Lysobacter sp. TY2-98]
MAHQIVIHDRFVEVIHSGDVGYPERLSALQAAKALKEIRPGMPLLINFLGAQLRAPLTNEEQEVRERIDYTTRVAMDSFFAHRRVAIVGGDEPNVRPASVAAQIRRLTFRAFSERQEGLWWLLEPA